MDIVIDKHISVNKGVSEKLGYKHGELTGVIRSMSVGDSFVIPSVIRNGMATRFKNCGMKCKTAKIDDEFVRVWRIA